MTSHVALAEVLRCLGESDSVGDRVDLLERAIASARCDDLLTALKDESERYVTIDARVSLRLAETLLCAVDVFGHKDQLAPALLAKANALLFLGRCPEARDLFDQAGRAFLARRDDVGWARTRTGWILTSRFLGDGMAALATVERAQAIFEQHGEWLRAGGLSLNTGIVCYELGSDEHALRFYNQAISFYDQARRSNPSIAEVAEIRTTKAKMNMAMILTRRGDFRPALSLHEDVREIWVQHGQAAFVGLVDQFIADAHAGQGYYTRALRRYADALDALERVGDELNATIVRVQMAECYLNLNRDREAHGLAEEAILHFERLGALTEAAKARLFGALARARLGDVDRALADLDRAATIFRSSDLAVHVGIATLQRAVLCLDEGDWPAAEEAAERARQICAARAMVTRQTQAELVEARSALALGRVDEAADVARSALAVAASRDLAWLAYGGHDILARVASGRGDLDSALDHCQAAIGCIEQVQGRLATSLRVTYLEDKRPVYDHAIDLCLRRGRPQQAFAYLERAKSRALVDYLASNVDIRLRARSAGDQGLLDELTRLREEHNWLYNRLYGLSISRPEEDHRDNRHDDILSDEETRDLEGAVQDREKRIGWILEQLSLRQADELEYVAPWAVENDPLPRLDERSVLLEYWFRDDAAVLFVVTRDGIESVPLAATSITVRQLLDRWRLNLAATSRGLAARRPLDALGRNARVILRELYNALIRPVEGHLAGRERLVVVPHGPTHAVPFHALADGRRHLIERMEVITCPSSSLLRVCASRPHRADASALVIAYSDAGRLPGAVDEARAVSTLLSGACFVEEAATRVALVESAPRHAVIHLAAHAEARLDNPTFAHLKLADGQLSTVDVFNLELQGALVTLSGCETGRSAVTGGDELIGLGRGFLFAGAATLVQSLWRVEDGSTARLMERFYRALRDGLTKGVALRQAQLEALAGSTDHPYFWAPFQLVGDDSAL